MMSEKSFWVECRENLKRRAWTCLLCVLTTILAMPVWQAMQLSAMRQRIETDPYYYGSTDPQQLLRQAFTEAVTSDGMLLVLIVIFAVLLAVQGFSWQNSRRKLDMYLSVPVSAGRRFLVICLNSILIFGFSYLAALLLTLLLGAAMGLMTGRILVCALAAFVFNMIFFLAVYHLTLVAVMMTGNVLTGLLATGVFFFYEFLMRVLFNDMREIFFRTWCRMSAASSTIWTSPLFSWTSDGVRYIQGYGSHYLVSFLKTMGTVTVQALVYGGIAYMLYRKRPAEAAGHAMAFPRSRTPVKLLLMLPITFLVGLWCRQLSEQSTFFTLLGMFIGLLIGHGLIQIIYDADIRSVLRGKWHILAVGTLSAALFAIFYYDLTGYDTWIPEKDEVREVAFTLQNDVYGMSHYDRPFTRDMEYRDTAGYILENMASGEDATLEAVRELARRDQEKELKDSDENCFIALVRYGMNSGRNLYRTIRVEREDAADQMDIIFGDEQFRNARYQIRDPRFMENAEDIQAVYSNGLELTDYPGDMEMLITAVSEDLESCTYSLTGSSLPVGVLHFRYHFPGDPGEISYGWSYPVYACFANTIGLLREQRVYMELTEEGSFVDPGLVDSITLTCYYQEESNDSDRAVTVVEGTTTETFTDPEDIARILPALYPDSLEDISGRYLSEGIKGRSYAVSVVFNPGVRFGAGDREQGRAFVVDADRLPGFAVEKLQYKD